MIVTEYAPDGSLKTWLQAQGGKAPSVDVAVEIGMAVLAGLEHLHVRGIVHRDLKPANVLMQGESPRIADFGLARVIGSGQTVSIVAGTPAYMAPEAFKGRRSVQTGLWSAGVVLHQLLGGGLPFPFDDVCRLKKAVAHEFPAALPASVPTSLRQAVARALNPATESRFSSAADRGVSRHRVSPRLGVLAEAARGLVTRPLRGGTDSCGTQQAAGLSGRDPLRQFPREARGTVSRR